MGKDMFLTNSPSRGTSGWRFARQSAEICEYIHICPQFRSEYVCLLTGQCAGVSYGTFKRRRFCLIDRCRHHGAQIDSRLFHRGEKADAVPMKNGLVWIEYFNLSIADAAIFSGNMCKYINNR